MTADLHHLAAAYALDALEPEERAAFEAHYPTCEICSVDVHDYRQTASLLNSEPVAPPDALRSNILSEIAETRQLAPSVPGNVVQLAERRRSIPGMVLGAAAAAIILIAGLFAVRTNNSSNDQELAAILAQRDIVVQTLNGSTSAGITVAWSASTGRLAVLADDLPALEDNDTLYALWMLNDDGATASVLFAPDNNGIVQQLGDLPGDPDGWGITIEPAGGSAQPTGDILYVTDQET